MRPYRRECELSVHCALSLAFRKVRVPLKVSAMLPVGMASERNLSDEKQKLSFLEVGSLKVSQNQSIPLISTPFSMGLEAASINKDPTVPPFEVQVNSQLAI